MGTLSGAERRAKALKGVVRIFAVSDIHVDYPVNLEWVDALAARTDLANDVLILCGDVSDRLPLLRHTLHQLSSAFGLVVFVPGNHELWVRGEIARGDPVDSPGRLAWIGDTCEELGIAIKPVRVGACMIVPLLSWHHKSFDTEPDVDGPTARLFACADYKACRWPDWVPGADRNGSEELAAWVDALNDVGRDVPGSSDVVGGSEGAQDVARALGRGLTALGAAEVARQHSLHVITTAHFLSDIRLLPEKRFLYLPALAKACGSLPLAARLRAVRNAAGGGCGVASTHVFGHSHFAWDTGAEDAWERGAGLGDGARYMQLPLAYPDERARRLPSLMPAPGVHAARGGFEADRDSIERACEDVDHVRSPWLPACVYTTLCGDSDAGGAEAGEARSVVGPAPRMACSWSSYYEHRARTPEDVTVAPWVARRRARRREDLS
ncbi:unnamed protein product [Pedinophyceae sp. YPF-701]|nr:unnamed protein product [Pedinophyceae sp. YPF-701]